MTKIYGANVAYVHVRQPKEPDNEIVSDMVAVQSVEITPDVEVQKELEVVAQPDESADSVTGSDTEPTDPELIEWKPKKDKKKQLPNALREL
jgi:hypothetical protein